MYSIQLKTDIYSTLQVAGGTEKFYKTLVVRASGHVRMYLMKMKYAVVHEALTRGITEGRASSNGFPAVV